MGERYKRNPNTKCVVCGKPIYKRPIEFKKNNGRVFCSMACYGISCRRETPCVVCNKPILAGFHKKTCSRGCANTHRSGIKYLQNRPKDKVRSQRALKIRLLKKLGNACVRCGYAKREILQIHHKDRDRGNSNLENLELICPNCHFEEHYLKKSWLKNLSTNLEGGQDGNALVLKTNERKL